MAINYHLDPLGPERPTQDQINAQRAAQRAAQHAHANSHAPKAQTPEALVEAARVATDRAFDMLIDYMRTEHESGYLNLYRLVPLAALVLGDRVQVGNASRYVYYYAKSQGYEIPSYPLSSSGEIKQFFADEGVANIPEWYEKIGIPAKDYNALQTMTAVAVRGRGAQRTLYLIKGDLTTNWLEFAPLEQSGITKKLPGYQLAYLLEAIGKAALATSGGLAQPSSSSSTTSSTTESTIEATTSSTTNPIIESATNSATSPTMDTGRAHRHKNPPITVEYLNLENPSFVSTTD